MIIRHPDDIRPSEITPRSVYAGRREFMKLAAGALGLSAAGRLALAAPQEQTLGLQKLDSVAKSAFSSSEPITAYRHITNYNNHYEFGTEKGDAARLSGRMKLRPWTVAVEGAVAKPRAFGIEELLKLQLEERVYRHRCVETWSMIVPWSGFPMRSLVEFCKPLGSARYVVMKTVSRPSVYSPA